MLVLSGSGSSGILERKWHPLLRIAQPIRSGVGWDRTRVAATEWSLEWIFWGRAEEYKINIEEAEVGVAKDPAGPTNAAAAVAVVFPPMPPYDLPP